MRLARSAIFTYGLEEVGHPAGVLLGILGIGIGVDGTGGHPVLLVALFLGVVVLPEVFERDKVVGVSMDEQHRLLTLGQGLAAIGLREGPAEFALGNDAGAGEDYLGQQRAHVLEVLGELAADRAVAAVFHEALHVVRQLLAAGHHNGGGAHGHAVQHHKVVLEQVVGNINPLHHIQAVLPAHLDLVTLGITVVLQVREEDIVVELVPVHTHQVEEHIVVVPVAVHHDGGAVGLGGIGGRHGAGVQLKAFVIGDPVILEDALGLEVVIPGGTARQQGIGLVARTLDIGLSVHLGGKGIMGHELAGQAAVQGKGHHEDGGL